MRTPSYSGSLHLPILSPYPIRYATIIMHPIPCKIIPVKNSVFK